MERREEELILALLPQYPELKTAYEEHTRLKAEVDKLATKSHLSADEEIENLLVFLDRRRRLHRALEQLQPFGRVMLDFFQLLSGRRFETIELVGQLLRFLQKRFAGALLFLRKRLIGDIDDFSRGLGAEHLTKREGVAAAL